MQAVHNVVDVSRAIPFIGSTAKEAAGAAASAASASSSASSSGHLLTGGIQTYLADALSSSSAVVPPACAADATTATTTAIIAASPAAATPPTAEEISLLREALAAFYGQPRDSNLALAKLDEALVAWQRQPPDERAALYRVRGDVHLDLKLPRKAAEDYATTITLLEGPGGEKADEGELPAARLGRARALRGAFLSGAQTLTTDEWTDVAQDYQVALRLSSRDDYLDTPAEKEADGAQRNPYAAWEWGMALRGAGLYEQASETHTLAALAFKDIGDRARSIIAELDAGIDLAAGSSDASYRDAKELLERAIPKTTGITSGADVELLQRVIAKEGEARMALASILWNAGDQSGAEKQLGEACVRFDQLEADNADREAARLKKGLVPVQKYNKVLFSIDDIPGAGGKVSCARFKNDEFLTRTVEWPDSLRQKVQKLNKLG